MNRNTYICLVLFVLVFQSCYKLPDNEANNPWETIDLTTTTPIRSMFAGPLELFLATDDELYRINTNNEVIEKRNITLPFRHFGRPIMSEFSLIRLVRTVEESQVAEIHLMRNPNEVYNFKVSEIPTNGEENFEVEGASRNPGAFNSDGSQFLLPMRVISATERYYAFFLLDINLNSTRNEFISVDIAQRINVPSLPGDPGNIDNIKFHNGHYYVTSKSGAYRISPDGTVKNPFTGWMFDTFQKNGKLYMTGFSDFEFYSSSDNGENWERVLDSTPIKMVESANNEIFFHQALGFRFELASEDFKSSKKVALNEAFPADDFAAFSNLVYFFGNYYMSVQKEVAFAKEVQTED